MATDELRAFGLLIKTRRKDRPSVARTAGSLVWAVVIVDQTCGTGRVSLGNMFRAAGDARASADRR